MFLKIIILIIWSLLKYIWHDSRIIILSGDIETSPGLKHSFSSQGLKICHWNLNSLSLHMYNNVFLLSAFISVHKLDTICISDTYLNSNYIPHERIVCGDRDKPWMNNEIKKLIN